LEAINSQSHQTENYIHLGAGLLVQKLKSKKDRFSNFIPPKKVKAFKEDAYAERSDLGITGRKTERGYQIDHVQKHSLAFEAGIRSGDVIYSINREDTLGMSEEIIRDRLTPEVGSFATLEIWFHQTGNTASIILESKSYFQETIVIRDVLKPGVLLIEITHFNQTTSADFGEALSQFGVPNIRHLIIDLRANQGGPPLATREVMGYFTPPEDKLFFIIRKNKKPFLLTSSDAGARYRGPVSVLVGPRTGSAAETMAGIFQHKKLGTVIGQKTAGASFLKSVYDYEDGSGLMLVTSKTIFHNFVEFPMEGLSPDIALESNVDALEYVIDHAGQ
jgi:carboxyl-terminal processing protease